MSIVHPSFVIIIIYCCYVNMKSNKVIWSCSSHLCSHYSCQSANWMLASFTADHVEWIMPLSTPLAHHMGSHNAHMAVALHYWTLHQRKFLLWIWHRHGILIPLSGITCDMCHSEHTCIYRHRLAVTIIKASSMGRKICITVKTLSLYFTGSKLHLIAQRVSSVGASQRRLNYHWRGVNKAHCMDIC